MTFPAALPIDAQLQLKPVAAADTAALFALVDANRGHLRRWLPWLDLNRNHGDTAAFIKRSQASAADGTAWNLLICEADRLRGTIGFNWIDHANRACELGYWLASDATGRGLATRSVACLIDFAFNDLALNRVNLSIATGNHSSRAVAQRLGFVSEGIAREAEWLYDHYLDLERFALLRRDWG